MDFGGQKERLKLTARILNLRFSLITKKIKKSIKNPLLEEIFKGVFFKKTPKIDEKLTYEEMFSKTNFHPIIEIDIINDLTKLNTENNEENILVLDYALETSISIFYSFDTQGNIKGIKEAINLLALFPETPYSDLIMQTISMLFIIFVNSEEKQNYNDVFQSISYFIINQETVPLQLLNAIFSTSLSINKTNEYNDNIFISNVFALFSMLIVDKTYFFDDAAFSSIFEITEQYLYNLNEHALGFFQHFNTLLSDEKQNIFVKKFIKNLPSIIERNKPYLEVTREEYVEIDMSQSPSSVMQFKERKTFRKDFEFDVSEKTTFEAMFLSPDEHFAKFSVLFKIMGSSKNEIESFIPLLLDLVEQKKETEFCIDYIGLYSLFLFNISNNINQIKFKIPSAFFDPSLNCKNEKSFHTIRYSFVYALLQQKNQSIINLLTETVKFPILFSKYVEIINEQTNLFVECIKKHSKNIQELGILSSQLQFANYNAEENNEVIENARISLFRLFYSIFQRKGMLETFLNNQIFLSFFLSLLFEEGIQNFALSQLRLYLSSNNFSLMFVSSLQFVIEQIVCAFSSSERYLKLLLRLIDTINKSINNFSPLVPLCEPLTTALVNLEKSDLSAELIFTIAEFYLNCNADSTDFNVIWFSAIGTAFLKLSLKDKKTYECLVQLAAGNFVSKISPKFILVNPYIANIMFMVFYETEIDVVSFFIKMCKYSVENAAKLHMCQFDLLILRYIKEHPDLNDKKLIQLFCLIASISSSPAVVQMYLSLLTPLENRYVLSSLTYLINPLKTLIEEAQLSPEVYLLSSEEYSYHLGAAQNLRNGFSISCWILVDNSQSKLFRMKDDEKTFLDISCNNSLLYINSQSVPCQIPRQRWSYLSFLIQENSASVYIDSNLIDDYTVSISLKFSDLTFCFGGEGATKVTNISLAPPASPSELRNIWRYGMRYTEDLYNSLVFISYNQITRIKPNMLKPFADILLRFFGIKILLPLLAHLDLKTKEGNESDLTAPIVISLLFDALMVSEKEEIDFVEAGGTKIISHLLTVADTKHLTYELYISIYNIFEQVLSESLQINILRNILLNFDLWCPAKPEHLIKILKHWEKNIFASYTTLFLQVLPFTDLLKNMRIYFWYTPPVNISEESRIRSPELNIEECRKILNSLAIKIAMITFTIDDYKSILLNALALSDTKQKYDMLCLLRDITNLDKSPISALDNRKVIDSLSIVNTLFNAAEENKVIVAIETIILVHKKTKFYIISLAEHLEVVFHIIKSNKVTDNFMKMMCGLLQKYPELFKIVSYFSFTIDSLKMYEECEPCKEFASIDDWYLWAVVHAIQMDSDIIFEYLTLCTPNQWKNIYSCVKSMCILHKYDQNKYCTKILSNFLSYMRKTKVEYSIGSEIINISIQFIFFHTESVNNALHEAEEQSPFKENFPEALKEEGELKIRFDSVIAKDLSPQTNYFTLNIETPEKWADIDLAKQVLDAINYYPTKRGAYSSVILSAFVAKKDKEFVINWFNKTKLPIKKLTLYPLVESYLNGKITVSSIEILNLSAEAFYDDDLQNSFVSVYESIQKVSPDCFKKAVEAFYLDQSKFLDCIVMSYSNQIETTRTFKEDNAKLWRRLWRNASVSGGPWATEKKEIKWKRDNSLCAGFYPCKMKPNRKFDCHIKASIVRDTGNAVSAETELEKYERELKKKYAENAPPEIFEVLEEEKKEDETKEVEEKAKLYSFQCELITLTKVTAGKFDIYRDYCHIVLDNKPKIHVIMFNTIQSILYRRRFHHKTGIEIFLFGGKTYLLNFPNDLSSTVVKRITEQELPIATYVQKMETPQFFKSLNFTEKWVNNEMSNFEYLMRLNIFSGRTFNDASQYPFFPWTISDFECKELNLNDEKVYRDLSKPVGCLGETRMNDLVRRMQDMKQYGQFPFLYSSFAICPLSLFLWNLRMEPFTTLHIDMQSGKFDHATRLFTSIAETYKLVTTHLNDYRELIPEFFFQSEFLVNENDFNLGNIRGNRVTDVVLPDFVKSNTAIEFIYLMRKSLESDYVSAHLNDWIDLFWGYKQRGKQAELANNLYNPFMYETIWTKENLRDPMRRASIEATMCHVGQIPPQLFTVPHPKRNPKQPTNRIKTIASISFESKSVWASTASINEDYIRIVYSDGENIKINQYMLETSEITEIKTVSLPNTSFISTEEILMTENGKLAKIEGNSVVYVEESLTSISHVSSCNKYHAIVSDEATLNIVGPKMRSVIPFYGECISCVAISVDFSTVVCGTITGNLVYCSLTEATKVNAVNCGDFVPTKIAITPSWGFVVAVGYREENGSKVFCYSVHDINGKLIKKGNAISSEVTCITTWADASGFDFVSVGCVDGKVYSCEAFYGFSIKANRCYSKVTSLMHLNDPECIVAIAENGNIYFVPSNTK